MKSIPYFPLIDIIVMSNSGRLILPSELISMIEINSSISHGGRFAISAVRSASANSAMSIVPDPSESAHSKNCAVVVPLAQSHFVSLTNSSLYVTVSSSVASGVDSISLSSKSPLGMINCSVNPNENAIAPSPTIHPLLKRWLSSGSSFVSAPVTGGISPPLTLDKISMPAHAAKTSITIDSMLAVDVFILTHWIRGVSPSSM